jgi:hypothetical protein
MARQIKKSDLPTKHCTVWESCWDEVKYCSDRCRRRKSTAPDAPDSQD